jgi:hypothetical protein
VLGVVSHEVPTHMLLSPDVHVGAMDSEHADGDYERGIVALQVARCLTWGDKSIRVIYVQ